MPRPAYLILHTDHPLHLDRVNGGREMAVLYLAKFLARRGERVVVAAQLVEPEKSMDGVEFWDLTAAYDTLGAVERAEKLGEYYLICSGRAQALVESKRQKNCLARILASHDRASGDTGLTAKTLARVADAVVCVSNAQREFFIRDGLEASRIHVFGNGTDHEVFRAAPVEQRDLNKLVFAGALVPDKGIHFLIHAFATLKSRYPKLTLDVYGSAALWGREPMFDEAQLQRSIPGLVFHGARPQSEIAHAYGTAGIAVVPSIWFDPFPLTAIEAQVTGCPVVTFNVGGLAEGVEPNVTGVVINEVTPEALTSALDQLLASPEKLREMSRMSLERQRTKYRWELVAEKYAMLCEQIAAGRKREELAPVDNRFSFAPSSEGSNGAKITVGIATFNRAQYLGEALESIFAEIALVHEILVVDDGCRDSTNELLARFAHPKLRTIRHEFNRGRAASRNTIVREMTGEYVLWIDDDDKLPPGGISLVRQQIESHPDADVIYGNYLHCDSKMTPLRIHVHPVVPREQLLMHMVYENILANGGVLIRRSLFGRTGPYNEHFPRGEDYEYWVRAVIAGAVFHHHQQVCGLIRLHDGNQANPINTKDQSKQQTMVVRYVMSHSNLRDIFPLLDWTNAPKLSASDALVRLAKIFFDHGDDDAALQCLDQSIESQPTAEAIIQRCFVLRAMRRCHDACEAFATAMVQLVPGLQSFHIELGAPRGSEKVAHEARRTSTE